VKQKHLVIPLECGEDVCQTSVLHGCGFVVERHGVYGGMRSCGLFKIFLSGKYVYEGGSGYYQTMRCKQCIAQEYYYKQLEGRLLPPKEKL